MIPWNQIKKGLMSVYAHKPFVINGAEGETRTPTENPPLDPEPSASTNSATSAIKTNNLKKIDLKSKLFYIIFFNFVKIINGFNLWKL